MINYEMARKLALEHIKKVKNDLQPTERRKRLTPKEREILGLPAADEECSLVLIDEATIYEDFGWLFFYQSEKYMETRDISDMLIGHGPLIISKFDGGIHQTGSAHSVEYYIEEYRKKLSD